MLTKYRKWYYLAIVCGAMAIAADIAGKSYAGQLMAATARETARIAKSPTASSPEYSRQKESLFAKLRIAAIAEASFVALFLVFWLISRWTREPARQVIPLVLLVTLILLQFLVV